MWVRMLEDTKGRSKGNIKGRLKIPKKQSYNFGDIVLFNAFEQVAPVIFILNKVFVINLVRSFFRTSDVLTGNQREEGEPSSIHTVMNVKHALGSVCKC